MIVTIDFYQVLERFASLWADDIGSNLTNSSAFRSQKIVEHQGFDYSYKQIYSKGRVVRLSLEKCFGSILKEKQTLFDCLCHIYNITDLKSTEADIIHAFCCAFEGGDRSNPLTKENVHERMEVGGLQEILSPRGVLDQAVNQVLVEEVIRQN